MLRNKRIFQISTLICLSSISICNLLIDLPTHEHLDTDSYIPWLGNRDIDERMKLFHGVKCSEVNQKNV
jgi:hypothetical protein